MIKNDWKAIKIKEETDELLHKCKEEFRKHHKDWDGKTITYNHILKQVCKFYLNT